MKTGSVRIGKRVRGKPVTLSREQKKSLRERLTKAFAVASKKTGTFESKYAK